MKIQMSLSDDLVKRLDNYSKINYLSRSAAVTIAVTQFLNANEFTSMMYDMSMAMRKIADTGELDEETKKQLDKLQNAIEFLLPSK